MWLYQYWSNLWEEAGVMKDQQVWPHAGKRMSANCRAQVSSDGTAIYWPQWRAFSAPPKGETIQSAPGTMGSGDAKVYGSVPFGLPIGGDFVRQSVVGLNYKRIP